MKVRVIASLVMALCLAVGSANASSIGVFFAPDASDCDGTATQFVPFEYYVIVLLGGDAAAGGITGAEFRLDGVNTNPGGWFNTVVASPASNVAIGNPIGTNGQPGGVNIAFPTCQGGGMVLLYTISSVALAAVPPTTFQINRHITPPNPNFQCPLVTLCDAEFTKLCLPGGTAFLNGGPCNIAVTPATWSQVKGLYNN
jgi:hypothetical protein